MSGFKGTPGPWNNKEISICRQHEAELQLGFLSTGDVSLRSEGLANAYLIAAAPELLEALQDAIHAHDKHGEHAEWDFARAAINKALGVRGE